MRERKKLEKLKIEEEDQKREKRIQDGLYIFLLFLVAWIVSVTLFYTHCCALEIAAEEEKKRKDKQLLQEQAKRELIEMQEKANKDAMIRKGKAAAATTSAAPPVSSRAQNTLGIHPISTHLKFILVSDFPPLLDEDRQSHRRDMNDYPPNNSNMGYHESREVYEPVNESVSYPKNSYNQQPQQPNRNVYPNPVQGDHSQIDFDNDPHFQAYLRRKAAESQYYSDNHGEYEQRHPAEQITTSQPGNFGAFVMLLYC